MAGARVPWVRLRVRCALCSGSDEPVAWAARSAAQRFDEGPHDTGSGPEPPGRAVDRGAPARSLTFTSGAMPSGRASVALGGHRVADPTAHGATFAEYSVLVTLGDRRWAVWRRFSDFRRLHAELARRFPAAVRASRAQLPARELLPGLRDKYLEGSRRLPRLQQYCQWLLLNEHTRGSHEFMTFLGVQAQGLGTMWRAALAPVGSAAAFAVWSGDDGAEREDGPAPQALAA